MKILLIAPLFYSYHKKIIAALEERGFSVYSFNEIPIKSMALYGFLQSYMPFLINTIWKLYNKKLEKCLGNGVTHVLIIRGYYLPHLVLEGIKRFDTIIKVIYYQWDSIQNNPNGLTVSKYADSSYTFDRVDSLEYKQFKYLPLFNSNPPLASTGNEDIDILCVASWTKQREITCMEVINSLSHHNIKSYIYWYLPVSTYLKLVLSRRLMVMKNIHIKPLNNQEYKILLSRARSVIDSPSISQSGISMRTIEALAQNKKVITTNTNIIHDDFYDMNMVYCIGESRSIESFIKNDSYISDTAQKGLLSLDGWLERMGL